MKFDFIGKDTEIQFCRNPIGILWNRVRISEKIVQFHKKNIDFHRNHVRILAPSSRRYASCQCGPFFTHRRKLLKMSDLNVAGNH